jgi:hypothetical protein
MNDTQLHEGGCLCGAVRYRAAGAPSIVEYCHCPSCRRISGSAVACLAGFPRENFEIVQGEPVPFESSPGVTRSFCGRCGTPMLYENERFAESVYLGIGTLDAPESLPPGQHVWVSTHIPWLEIADDLPRYRRFRSDEV